MPLNVRVIDDVEHTWSSCGKCGGTGIWLFGLMESSRCNLCKGVGWRWQVPRVHVSPCPCCASRGCGCDAMQPDGPDCLFEVCGCCWDRFCECQGGVIPKLVAVVPPGGVMLDLTLEKAS